MFYRHDVCVTWAHLRLANLEFAVHVGIKSVVSSSQPEQNDLLWSVQFVQAVWPVRVWVLRLPFLLGEGFDGLFIGGRGVSVLLVELASVLASRSACWTRDLMIGILVATLPGAWPYSVRARTGWPGVSIISLGEIDRSAEVSVVICWMVHVSYFTVYKMPRVNLDKKKEKKAVGGGGGGGLKKI